MQGTQNVGVQCRWTSRSQIWHEEGNYGDAVNLLSISTSTVTIGNGSNDVDFVVYGGSANEYFKIDCGNGTFNVGADDYGLSNTFYGDTASCYFSYNATADKMLLYRTTASTSPGRLLYIQHIGSAMGSGETIQGLQLRSRATGTGVIAGGTDGAEIKCGLNSDSDTGTLATARAIIANVDAKKGTITTAHGVEMQVDIAAGGTISTMKGFRASLNNSGTLTNSYAFIVETANTTYPWKYGLYIASGQATYPIDVSALANAATGHFYGIQTTVANTGTDRTAGVGNIMKGASFNVNPASGKTTGRVYGSESCVYIGGTTTVSGLACAVFAEIQGGTTISSDYYAIWAYTAPSANPSGTSAVMRLEHNGSADNYLDAWICFVGGKGSYVFDFGPLAAQTAWNTSGSSSSGAGWLKVNIGAVTRYIQLYDDTPS